MPASGRQNSGHAEYICRRGCAVSHAGWAGPYKMQVLAPGFAAETVAFHRKRKSLCVRAGDRCGNRGGQRHAHSCAGRSRRSRRRHAQRCGSSQPCNPSPANDAVRFLPGAVINTAGQHGGLSSLFVRGGESNYNKVIVDGVTVNEPGGTFDFGTLSHGAGRSHGIRSRRAEHTLWIGCHDERSPSVDSSRQHACSRTALWRRRREFRNGERSCFACRRTRTFRLQLVRRPVQYERLRRKRCLLRLAGRSECGSQRSATRFLCAHVFVIPTATLGCRENGTSTERPCFSRQIPSEWSQLNNLLGRVELAVAAPYGMATSLHRIRLRLSL